MTTIEIVAACIAIALFLAVLIILRSISRAGVMTIPRKPQPREAEQLESEEPIESPESIMNEGAAVHQD